MQTVSFQVRNFGFFLSQYHSYQLFRKFLPVDYFLFIQTVLTGLKLIKGTLDILASAIQNLSIRYYYLTFSPLSASRKQPAYLRSFAYGSQRQETTAANIIDCRSRIFKNKRQSIVEGTIDGII